MNQGKTIIFTRNHNWRKSMTKKNTTISRTHTIGLEKKAFSSGTLRFYNHVISGEWSNKGIVITISRTYPWWGSLNVPRDTYTKCKTALEIMINIVTIYISKWDVYIMYLRTLYIKYIYNFSIYFLNYSDI